MSDEPEIEQALAEALAKQRALETALQARRDEEAAALARVQHEVDAQTARLAAHEARRVQLVELARQMELERGVILGFSRQGWRLVQQLIRLALMGCSLIGLLMLGGLEPVSGLTVLVVCFGGGWLAWLMGDEADHLELQ